jgi:L-iditol 2-dehydrogenase
MLSQTATRGIFGIHAKRLPRARMKALLKEGSNVSVQLMPRPELTDARSVVVRVAMAGLCRTDLYAAEGKIKVCDPLVLGHEFSGVIEEVGSEVNALKTGQRVTVNPILPCLKCQYCQSGNSSVCQNTTFLGVDRCGCFAEFVSVPASAVLPLPDGMSDLAAAYTEPVAASLAVLKANLQPEEKGLIYGSNRFSQLLKQILNFKSLTNITIYDPSSDGPIDEGSFDYVVETIMTSESLSGMVRAIRPGGKIVLKSRQYEPVALKMTELLKKEPVMHVCNYGSFEDAIELLATGKLDIDSLVDGIYDLEDFPKVLRAAKQKESLKPFFAPGGSR